MVSKIKFQDGNKGIKFKSTLQQAWKINPGIT